MIKQDTESKAMMNLDEDLLEQVRSGTPWTYRSWEPTGVAVVLGRGNTIELEIYEARCRHDHVPLLRRRGGGGTVLLSPGILVISLVKLVRYQYHFKEYFHQINDYLIESLRKLGIANLNQQGSSDICIADKKILGSSMYRSKDLLFYTASLMVSNELHLIDRYLKHPSKEPDYRRGRSHHAFVITLAQVYPELSVERVKKTVDAVLQQRIPEIE